MIELLIIEPAKCSNSHSLAFFFKSFTYASILSYFPCSHVKNKCLKYVIFFHGSQYQRNSSFNSSTASLKLDVLNTLIASPPATCRNVTLLTLSDFSFTLLATRKSSNFWIQILQFSARFASRLNEVRGFICSIAFSFSSITLTPRNICCEQRRAE